MYVCICTYRVINCYICRCSLKYINRINDPKNGYLWEAKSYDDFVGKSYSQMRNLLGNNNYLKNIPYTKEESDLSNFLELEIKVHIFF